MESELETCWLGEDEAIIATNTDATECKRSAVELGYWKDDYIKLFVRRVDRKPPEINQGYYARVRAIDIFIHQFLERCGNKCQIINLGCGFDTMYWRLKDSAHAVTNFIELDLPTVTAKKCNIIKRNKQLLEKINSEDGEVIVRGGAGAELHADGYHLVGCDLRSPAEVRKALDAAGATPDLPALILAECVLVYLRPDPQKRLLSLLSSKFPTSVALIYEQCNLSDKFGEVMLRNLVSRGCDLCGAAFATGPPQDAADRLMAAGWPRALSWDMRRVWAALPDDDRARVESLEPLDEKELLHQLHAHYALTLATSGQLFADMDLERESM